MADHIDASNSSDDDSLQVRRYAMVIEWADEDQVFLVNIPDFPGVHTHGQTRSEAAAMGEEVIALMLQDEPNPPPARCTAMPYPVRPEAQVGDFAVVAKLR